MSDVGLLVIESLIGAAGVGAVATGALASRDDPPVLAEVRFPPDLTAVQVETLLGHIASLARGVAVTYTVEAMAEGLRSGVDAPYGPFRSLTSAQRGIAPWGPSGGNRARFRRRLPSRRAPGVARPVAAAAHRGAQARRRQPARRAHRTAASGCVWWFRSVRPAASGDRSRGHREPTTPAPWSAPASAALHSPVR